MSKINKHVASFHLGERLFKSDTCDNGSNHKGHLNKHVASVHKGKNPFNNEFC